MPSSMFAVPPTQNSAPVIEFRCLYTHDLRRKQKRWNDGTLNFHTFNKRIMVYDSSMNYISDAHWNDEMLQDGDEVTLQNGVMVEVSEALRTTTTDLTPLFAARQRPGVLQPTRINQSSAIRPITSESTPRRDVERQKHKPLTALLGTSNGALGKAVAPQSPYAARHQLPDVRSESGPSAKKHKSIAVSDGHPWKVTAVTKKASSKTILSKTAPLQPQTSGAPNSKTAKKATKKQPPPVGQTTLRVKQVIDITSDADCTPSPSNLTSPDLAQTKPRAPETAQLFRDRITANKGLAPIALEPTSPRANPMDRVHNVHASLQSPKSLGANRTRNPRTRALQLSKAKPKSKLLCMQNASIKEAQSLGRATTPILVLSDGDEVVQELSNRQRARRKVKPQTEASEMDTDGFPPPQDAREEDIQGLLNEAAPGSRILKALPNRCPSNESPDLNMSDIFPPPVPGMFNSSPEQLSTDLHEMGIAYGRMDEQLLQSRLNRTTLSRSVPSPTRLLRRVQSENDTPLERNSETEQPRVIAAADIAPSRGLTRQVPLQRAQTMMVGGHWSGLPDFRQPPSKEPTMRDVGPWSTEAFDLFDWHPPDWEERVSKLAASVAMVD